MQNQIIFLILFADNLPKPRNMPKYCSHSGLCRIERFSANMETESVQCSYPLHTPMLRIRSNVSSNKISPVQKARKNPRKKQNTNVSSNEIEHPSPAQNPKKKNRKETEFERIQQRNRTPKSHPKTPKNTWAKKITHKFHLLPCHPSPWSSSWSGGSYSGSFCGWGLLRRRARWRTSYILSRAASALPIYEFMFGNIRLDSLY